MKAVYKHELSSYFTSLTGYIFGAFLLLFAGIYCMVYNLKSGLPYFEYVLGGMSFVFLVIVPILTMRVLAEERRQKTDQLLYSLPISMTEVVLGKFFALMTLFLIPLAIICIYPLVLCLFGSVYLPAAYGAVVAFLFLGASLIAIGTFISSVTESQPVAAGICFVVMLLNYFLYSLASYTSTSAFASFAAFAILVPVLAFIIWRMTKNGFIAALTGIILELGLMVWYLLSPSAFGGLFPKAMEKLSLFERFNVFIGGVFDISGIVYFASVTAVFLFLSIQSMEKRRWSE